MLVFTEQLYIPGHKDETPKLLYVFTHRKGKLMGQILLVWGSFATWQRRRSVGTRWWEWMAMKGVQQLVLTWISFLHPSLSPSALRPVALQVYFLLFTGGITLADDQRGDKGPVTATILCWQRTEAHQELQCLNVGRTNRWSSVRPTSPISCLGSGLLAVVLQAGQTRAA